MRTPRPVDCKSKCTCVIVNSLALAIADLIYCKPEAQHTQSIACKPTFAKCQEEPKPEPLDLILRAFMGPMLGAVMKNVSFCKVWW